MPVKTVHAPVSVGVLGHNERSGLATLVSHLPVISLSSRQPTGGGHLASATRRRRLAIPRSYSRMSMGPFSNDLWFANATLQLQQRNAGESSSREHPGSSAGGNGEGRLEELTG